MKRAIPSILLAILLAGCAHHPADCAIGIPWSDCLEGTAGYNNGGGSDTREIALKIEKAKKEGAESAVNSSNKSSIDKLKELDSMHKQGLITDAEYQQKRKQILDSL